MSIQVCRQIHVHSCHVKYAYWLLREVPGAAPAEGKWKQNRPMSKSHSIEQNQEESRKTENFTVIKRKSMGKILVLT